MLIVVPAPTQPERQDAAPRAAFFIGASIRKSWVRKLLTGGGA